MAKYATTEKRWECPMCYITCVKREMTQHCNAFTCPSCGWCMLIRYMRTGGGYHEDWTYTQDDARVRVPEIYLNGTMTWPPPWPPPITLNYTDLIKG